MSNAQRHTLFAVDKIEGTPELLLPAATELFVVGYADATSTVTPAYEDKLPGLFGDFAPDATAGGETTPLADRSSIYTPGTASFPEKTLNMKVSGAHPKVQELWAHAATNDQSAKANAVMGYNCMNADRSGWRGVLQVKTMNIPTDVFQHNFTIQYLNRIYIAIANNPVPVAP